MFVSGEAVMLQSREDERRKLDAYSSGYFLLLPKVLHITTLSLLAATLLATTLPSILLFDYVPNLMSGALIGQGILLGLIAAPCVALTMNALRVKSVEKGKEVEYIPLLVGLDRVVICVAIGALLFLLVAAANLVMGYSKCGTYGDEGNLFEWVYAENATMIAGNTTTGNPWSALRRRPQFGIKILWFQLCLEDLPFAIIVSALYIAMLAIDIVIIAYMSRLRTQTIKLLNESVVD